MTVEPPDRAASAIAERAPGNRLKYLVSMAASAGLLLLLFAHVDPADLASGWKRIAPGYVLLALTSFIGVLIVRGLRLRRLAQMPGRRDDRFIWVRLAALHQILFSVMPSGLGDLGFPALAARLSACSGTAAARVLLVYRLQDLWLLVILAASGLLLQASATGVDPVLIAGGLVAAAVLLLWSYDLTRLIGLVILRHTDSGRGAQPDPFRHWLVPKVRRVALELDHPVDWGSRLHDALATLLAWALAAGSLWCLFAMIDITLGLGQTLLVIAGLNLVGAAAAFTIAGLGVSETGLAAILLALGFSAPEAIATALIVRPAALVNIVISCGFVEACFRLLRRRPT